MSLNQHSSISPERTITASDAVSGHSTTVEMLIPTASETESSSPIASFLARLISKSSNTTAKEILFKVAENPEDVNKDGFIDPSWLSALPENIANRIRKDGFLLKKFKEGEKEVTLEQDINNRLWSVFVRGFLPLIADDVKSVNQGELQSYVAHIFNTNVLDNIKRLPHYSVLQLLESDNYDSKDLSAFKKELKAFIREELMPQLLKLLNYKQDQQTPEIDLLVAMLESELDLITEAGRPALLHLVESEDGRKSFSCELPYTETSIASYKRDGELANASYRVQGFVDNKRVKITSDQYRNASFDSYDLPDLRARFASTRRNLYKWIIGSIEISANEGKLLSDSTKENPIDYLVTDVTLLSMLSESADGVDPQDARRQIMNIFHAANEINARTEPMEISVKVNGELKTIFVKPRVSVAALAMNSGRYFTSTESAGIQNRALITLFEELPGSFPVIYDKFNIPNGCLEIAGMMRNLLGLNADGREAYQKAQRNYDQLLEAYRSNTNAVDDLVDRQFELDALVIEKIAKYFSKNAQKCIELIANLESELSKDPHNKTMLEIYNFAVDLHDLMDLQFTQTWQEALSEIPVLRCKGLDEEYNGYTQANFLRMSQRVAKATTGHCNDGEDRRGFVAVASKAYEDVAAKQSGKTPRLYVRSEIDALDNQVKLNMPTDASLGITYANNPAGGFEIHHRDLGNKVNPRDLEKKMPDLAKEPFRKAHKEKHASGFKTWLKNLFLPLIIAFGGLLMTVPAGSDLSKVNDPIRVGGTGVVSQAEGSTSTTSSTTSRDEGAPLQPGDKKSGLDDGAAPLVSRRRDAKEDGDKVVDPNQIKDTKLPRTRRASIAEIYATGSAPLLFSACNQKASAPEPKVLTDVSADFLSTSEPAESKVSASMTIKAC